MSFKDECISWCEDHGEELMDDGTFWEVDDMRQPVSGPYKTDEELQEHLMAKAIETQCGRI